MSTNLYVSTSGALSRLGQLEVLANNLANVDTTGFKADQAVFRETLEGALLDENGQPTPGGPLHSFVSPAAVRTDHSSGTPWKTGSPLDVTIDGPGFFVVDTPSGARFTRAGSFAVSAEGQLVSRSGHPVLGDGGPISGSPVRILGSGEVTDAEGRVLGRLRVDRFEEPALLKKEGDSLFLAPPLAVGEPVQSVALLEGSLERSNVNAVRELANLIMLQRAYDISMQMIRRDDAATERLLEEVSQ